MWQAQNVAVRKRNQTLGQGDVEPRIFVDKGAQQLGATRTASPEHTQSNVSAHLVRGNRAIERKHLATFYRAVFGYLPIHDFHEQVRVASGVCQRIQKPVEVVFAMFPRAGDRLPSRDALTSAKKMRDQVYGLISLVP